MDGFHPNAITGRRRGSSGWRMLAWLMMLVIFGIPTVIAYRAYDTMKLRRQSGEGVALAARAKAAVEDYYGRNHLLPVDAREAGVATSDREGLFVHRLAVAEGKVTVTYGNQADGRIAGTTLAYAPREEGARLVWRCGSSAGTTLPVRWRPKDCRE